MAVERHVDDTEACLKNSSPARPRNSETFINFLMLEVHSAASGELIHVEAVGVMVSGHGE